MGFWSSIIWREVDDEPVSTSREAVNELPELYNGMTLDLETTDGVHILTGRLTGYAPDDTALSLERLPGGLSFSVRDVGTSVLVRGVTESMTQFFLKGTIQESSRLICRLKDVKVKLMDYAPMEFIGEIIRVVEYQPGKFRYGFLFAQLKEGELTELTRTLYNIQVGNRSTRVRSEEGHW